MSDRLRDIRDLAEACVDPDLDTVQDGGATYKEFAAEAHPQAILELLDRIEELETKLDDLKLRHSVLKDIHDDNNRDYRERIEKEIDDFIAEEQSHS